MCRGKRKKSSFMARALAHDRASARNGSGPNMATDFDLVGLGGESVACHVSTLIYREKE